eukprot:UN17696
MEHTQKGMEQIEERVRTTEENLENISREANHTATVGAVPKDRENLAEMDRTDVKTVAMKCLEKERRNESRTESLMEKVNSGMTNDTAELVDTKVHTVRNQLLEDLGSMSKITEVCYQMIEIHQETGKNGSETSQHRNIQSVYKT